MYSVHSATTILYLNKDSLLHYSMIKHVIIKYNYIF